MKSSDRSSPGARLNSGRLLLGFLVAGALFFGLACSSGGSGSAPTLKDPNATGKDLVNTYMTLLAHKDVQGLGKFISDGFLRQGSEGSFFTKADYLKNLPMVGDFVISDVTAQQAGDALVIRWLIAVPEVIGGKTLSTAPAPRLATFTWIDGRWQLLSHANFNPIATPAQ